MSGQTFAIRVAGVSKDNNDGTNRQLLLRRCSRNESVKLIREPDNPYDKHAIAVHRRNGDMLGYIPVGDVRLADHLDRGGAVKAKIRAITGGPTILQRLFRQPGRSYGCVLEITKGDFDWQRVAPFRDQDGKASDLARKAHSLEKTRPSQAIETYREALDLLVDLDNQGQLAQAWRTTRLPVNRLSLLLERQGEHGECRKLLDWYSQYSDPYPPSPTDMSAIRKRRKRVQEHSEAQSEEAT